MANFECPSKETSIEVKTWDGMEYTVYPTTLSDSYDYWQQMWHVNLLYKSYNNYCFRGLAALKPNTLPSHGTIKTNMREANFVANKHVHTKILNTPYLVQMKVCLRNDDYREFESYQVSLASAKPISIGLNKVSSQSPEKDIISFESLIQ